MPLIAIAAADIDAAGRSLEADLPVAWLDASVAESEAHATSPGHISARLSRCGAEIVVQGRAHAALEVSCARCLEPTKLDIDAELSLLLKPMPSAERAGSKKGEAKSTKAKASKDKDASGKERDRAAVSISKPDAASDKGASGKRASKSKDKEPPEYEFSSDEAEVDVYDGELVVLDGFVREAILLEMPIFPLCSESCPGIRPASPEVVDGGAEPPLDPRLAPLRALRAGLAGSASGPRGSGESTEDQRAASGHADAPHEKKTKKE